MICVGIDVAKDKHDCFILNSEGAVLVDVFTIANNLEGFNTLLDKLRAHVEAQGLELFVISAAAHQGTRELVLRAAQLLQELPPVTVYEPTYVERPPEVDTDGAVDIQEFDGTWVVDAPWLQRLIANVNFGDYESRNWFDQKLRQSGLFDKLEEMGIKDGDIVSMYDLEFEYQR